MRNSGKTWVVLIAILIVILLIALGVFRWYVSGYNKAVNFEQGAEKGWADIDAALQRRLDLVPNLVNTVKGYAEHEKELFENIAKSREKYFQSGNRAGKIEASNELSGFLSRLIMLQENYPQLKASENFRDLQTQLEGTENRIAVARTRYNLHEAILRIVLLPTCRRGKSRLLRGHRTGKIRSAESRILTIIHEFIKQ